MWRVWGHAAALFGLGIAAGCAVGYPGQFETIKTDPLASTELLGLRLETASGSAGLRGRAAPYVFRVFENPDEPPRRLVERVKQVGVDSGWTSEDCSKIPGLGGEGAQYLLYLTKLESAMHASVSADDAELTVKVEYSPSGAIAERSQGGEASC